jgi:hypothetical protein
VSNDISCALQVAAPTPAGATPLSSDAAYAAALVDASPTQQRLAKELFDKGFSTFR